MDVIIIYSGRCPFLKKVSTKRSIGGSADGREQPETDKSLWKFVKRTRVLCSTFSKVVYHAFTLGNTSVHGLVNGKQNSLLSVNFVPGIAFIICTNRFHLPKNRREGLKLVSKIALMKWNTNFRLEHCDRENRSGIPFQTFRCSRKFSAGKTRKVIFHFLSNRISANFL